MTSDLPVVAIDPPKIRAAHRAGPIEQDGDRLVQRCLRCDALVNVVTGKIGGQEIKLGRRVFLGHETKCYGILGADAEP